MIIITMAAMKHKHIKKENTQHKENIKIKTHKNYRPTVLSDQLINL